MLVMGLSAVAYAGPGSVVIKTDGDITAKFGAQVRFVPTYEKNWDFGIKEKTGNASFLPHTMEFGTVSNGYIRSEDRLYFNFAKGDIWDVYFALEFDDAVQSRTSDRIRQTQGDESSFGVERLNASVKLPWISSRFNAGWDVYAVDLDAGSLVYGDDDPGFSIQGGIANIDWKLGYHKKIEVNRRVTSADRVAANNITNTGYDNDRDVWSARVNYTLFKDTKLGLIYALNDQKVRGNVATNDPCVAPTCQNVNANFISPIFTASIAGFKIAAQYAHTWGSADKMGVDNDPVTAGIQGDYDISSNAAFADIAYDMTPMFGFRFIPHVGVLWSQGDDNPSDNKLEGYSSITSLHQFFPSFGGENTFLAGANPVVGTTVYSFLPDQRGNQNAFLGTGGIGGTGRGDNPGLLLIGGGITVDPIKNWSYRTNAYYLRYNEDLCVQNATFNPVQGKNQCGPILPSGALNNVNLITERDIGVEWDNEVSWWLDKNMVIKGQFSFLFPTGDGIRQVTQQLAGVATNDTAIRLAVEMLWNF
jgi:hypothetical protein